MSITKTTLILTAALGMATAACAQDASTYDPNTEVLDTTATDHFGTSDLNADGGLDRAEFEGYVQAKADAGESAFVALAETGEMDVEFMTLDANADGVLDAGEVAGAEVEVDVDVETDSMDDGL